MKKRGVFDWQFLKRLFRLSQPIVVHNLFSVLSSTASTLLTGQLGDVAVASTGLLRQFVFLLKLIQFGTSTGCAIFTAQFWGRNDRQSIKKTLGLSLVFGAVSAVVFTGVALAFPVIFLRLFTADAEVLDTASRLLRIAGVSFLFQPVIYAFTFNLRAIGETRLPMLASIAGIIVNLTLGYGLINGRFGLPTLGVYGAAVAFLAGPIVEALVLIWLAYRIKTPLSATLQELLSFDRAFVKRILTRAMPVMLNELAWGIGITTYTAIYARLGTTSYTAYTIKDSIESLLFVPVLGVTGACATLVGNTIGEGKPERAAGYVRQTFLVMAGVGMALGAALFLLRNQVLGIFDISGESRGYALGLLTVVSFTLWLRSSNFVFFIGMMRSGGDTRFASLMDLGALWGMGLPLALLGAFVFRWTVPYIYLLVLLEEAVKFIVSLRRFRSRKWINDLVNA